MVIEEAKECLFIVFERYFLFSKKNKNKKNIKKTFIYDFFFSKKYKKPHKILNLYNKNNFQRTLKWCSLYFQKLFSISIFKKQ